MCGIFKHSPPVCRTERLIDAASFLTLSYGLILRKDFSNVEVASVSG